MRILITGGAGFIGSHLCDRFLAEGHQVIAMDNLSTSTIDNIAHLADRDGFSFIKHDVTNYIYVEGHLDAILHLASLPSPVDYLEKPIPTLKVGALGTHKALGLALAKKATFLLASTSEVYGDPQEHPQHEDYWGHVNPVGPRGVYDESKRFAEAITMAYHRYHGVDTRIARIFNTYGPSMRLDDGRVVSNFVTQALRGKPLTVYDDGSRTRSFCYISDMVEGLYRLLLSDEVYPVNLGNPNEMTILEFAHQVLEVSGSSSEIVFIAPTDERTKDDPQVRRPDISKAQRVLNW
ncbi:MAG: UDP-glucuronic acid decarboxylase family protein, partial [Anaerolineae bacterium]